jgi:DNA-binding transcriptional LysR family regulator
LLAAGKRRSGELPNTTFLVQPCLFGISHETMELRHLRYYLAVAEASSFTKAATQLRIAQPALSRQIQDLEEEIGVSLIRRGSRGISLTPEGRLYLAETRELLKRAEESVAKVRAMSKGEYGELNIGYAPSPSLEILPPALAAFQKAVPGVRVILHDLSGDELSTGLLDGSLDLTVMGRPAPAHAAGIEFEELRRYPFCVAAARGHPFVNKRRVSVQELAGEPLVVLRRRDYSEFHQILGRIFSPHHVRPRIAVECDGANSLIAAVEGGQGVALVSEIFKHVGGKRLIYRPLLDASEVHTVGIGRPAKRQTRPAEEKFCDTLREISVILAAKKAVRSKSPRSSGSV